MEKSVAARLMKSVLSIGNEINMLDAIISGLENGQEKQELVQALGNVMGVLTRDFVFRICRDYPELDPEQFRSRC